MQSTNVLFLCTGNSARSILAEALLNKWGAGSFCAYSAGSHPVGKVHPLAIELLKSLDHPTENLRSKSFNEFASAPVFDLVITVCDNAAGETCPLWPGSPVKAHWGMEDPAAAQENRRKEVFLRVYRELERRIKLLAALPPEQRNPGALKKRLDEIKAMAEDMHQ